MVVMLKLANDAVKMKVVMKVKHKVFSQSILYMESMLELHNLGGLSEQLSQARHDDADHPSV